MSNNNTAMRLFSIYMLFLSSLALISCQEDESTFSDSVEVNDNFNSSMMDWSGDFASNAATKRAWLAHRTRASI